MLCGLVKSNISQSCVFYSGKFLGVYRERTRSPVLHIPGGTYLPAGGGGPPLYAFNLTNRSPCHIGRKSPR